MALKAVFFGINKYVDRTIPELSGARRDPMALWALFTDTYEELAARLPVARVRPGGVFYGDKRELYARLDGGIRESAYQRE